MACEHVPVYHEPCLDADEGQALLRHDVAMHYFIGNLKVVTIEPQLEFTGLTCTDGITHYVRTADFQRVCSEPLQAVYCSCGHLVVGMDSAHLQQLARAHNGLAHPETPLSDDAIRAVVTAKAFPLEHPQEP
ncbi:MAG: hypothetical protein RLZZ387_4162 [Chloroflexota bacterium]|jgi:hypothetical protein